MERQKATQPLYHFSQLDEITAPDEFLIKQQILRYRLIGLSETSIYFSTGRAVPMDKIREYVREIDGWIESGVSQVMEHLNEKDMDRLLTVKRLDYIIEERVVLYQTEENNNTRLRILNAMRDDIDRRADLLGLKQGVRKDNSHSGPDTTDLPEVSLEELMDQLSKSVGKEKKG